MPSNCKSISQSEIKAIIEQYKEDLPHPELAITELARWQLFCQEEQSEIGSITTALDKCDIDIFPNINTLLKLSATLPVTTVECERSFSTLRRLNTYLRATQSSQRLDSLALINIHCDLDINIDQVIDMFSRLHPRRMELTSVLFKE